ncbi:MAG: hypothetical protein HQ582_03180 [Planctomycetes bacterium]|nr:hypothetical protein [Planctomycetota bacterium]
MERKLNLDSGLFCRQPIKSSSKYAKLAARRCHHLARHSEKCVEMPFLAHLSQHYPRVAAKIQRDSIMTTGAAWKSEEAGPNRILRWVMLESEEKLAEFGIRMHLLKPQVVAKLREKAADYDSCIRVAMRLTLSAYEMEDAPPIPDWLAEYFRRISGEPEPGKTTCAICLLPISFSLFKGAQRGKAFLETCHKDPRQHTPENVGFAHRECNIAQGPKSLDEFYDWISGILKRARPDLLS